MNYRPITDVWILARPKVKYYGAYPNGFLERAKPLIGARPRSTPVLHVCGGHAKAYPNKRVMGPNDYTLDLDPETKPDYLQDARHAIPVAHIGGWHSIICDPPYTEQDAAHYRVGASVLPSATALLRNALKATAPGGRVGMLHFDIPRPPKDGVRFLACIGVVMGYGNAGRWFTVFETEDA